jgi:DNA replicative helicase MCM subunit Mcm2 (Cdc46/Mcm family)
MSEFEDLMKIQNQIRQGLLREQKEDKTLTIMSIINELTSGPKEIVQLESLIIEAASRDISENEVISTIERLKKDNVIYETQPGFFKKT